MVKSTKEICFETLKAEVLSLALSPGEDLDESRLSERFGMSRTPLREVLQRLAGEGYVEISSNRGAKVAAMDITRLRVFFQTAPMIYAAISRLAAEAHTGDDLSKLIGVQTRFRAAIAANDPTEAALQNHAFHACLGAMARNPYLMACLDRLLIDHTRLGQTFYRAHGARDTARITAAADQHDAMIAAIKARDADAAVALTSDHWDLSRHEMERFVRPDPLPLEGAFEKDHSHAV